MQVFIIGTPLETAMALSKRHLNNQINEAKIILDALNGAKAWSNHPCVLQYRGCEKWLDAYAECLKCWQAGDVEGARVANLRARQWVPTFHTEAYINQMKRRLYTKDEKFYFQYSGLGKSQENWYFVDNEWRKYINGKRIE